MVVRDVVLSVRRIGVEKHQDASCITPRRDFLYYWTTSLEKLNNPAESA